MMKLLMKIVINKYSEKCKEMSRECSLCKFYYFLDKKFNYGPYLCNGCYDMSLKAIL